MAVKTNYKMNGKDYYRISASFGHDANGKLIRKFFYGKSKKEAEAKKAEYVDSLKSGLSADFNKAFFGPTMRTWLFEILKSTVKPSTFERYEGIYRKYIKTSELFNVKCCELSSLQIQRYLNELKSEGKTEHQVKFVYRLAKQFLYYCEREGYILRNPCKSVNVPKFDLVESEEEVETFSNDEIKLLAFSKDSIIKYISLVSLSTGMRRGEVLGLNWKDIDIDNKLIHIRRTVKTVTKIDNDGTRSTETITQTPKNKSSIRDIPLSDSLIKIFNKVNIKQKENRLKLGESFNPNNLDYIFLTKNGELIDTSNFTRAWKRLLKRLDIKQKKFHALRHTFATKQFEAGTKILTVSRLLGHSNTLITEKTYTHVLKKEKEKSFDILNSLDI